MCDTYNKAVSACGQPNSPDFGDCMDDHTPPMDCIKSPNPTNCNTAQKARDACRGKRGSERANCIQEKMPHISGSIQRVEDCSKTADPKMCESYNKAVTACANLTGPDQQACMEDQRPATDCSKFSNPAQCKATEQAFQACKGKRGSERSKCMQERLAPAR